MEPDPVLPDHFYAVVDDYLEFDRAVPFKEGELYFESALQKEDGSTNKGRLAGRCVLYPTTSMTLSCRQGSPKLSGPKSGLII